MSNSICDLLRSALACTLRLVGNEGVICCNVDVAVNSQQWAPRLLKSQAMIGLVQCCQLAASIAGLSAAVLGCWLLASSWCLGLLVSISLQSVLLAELQADRHWSAGAAELAGRHDARVGQCRGGGSPQQISCTSEPAFAIL